MAKARRFYPKRDTDDEDEDKPLAVNLPLLLARVNRTMNGEGGDDEDERLDEEDGSGREDNF